MKTGLAFADTTCAILTSPSQPSRNVDGTVGVMTAAMLDVIGFTVILERMEPGSASTGFAHLVDAFSRLPAFHVLRTLKTMLATIIHAVLFTYHVIVVLIRFASRGPATALEACFGIFITCDIAFAVLICTTILDRCFGIDARTVAAYKSLSFTRILGR